MCNLFARGNPITVVCSLVGIAPTTYHSWMDKGDEDVENGVEGSIFSEFSNRVREAQAKAQAKALKIVWDSAEGGKEYTKTVVERFEKVSEVPDPDWDGQGEPKFIQIRQLVSEKTVVTTEVDKPNSADAKWFLERVNRAAWSRSLGLTGGDGEGPVQIKQEGGLDLESLDDAALETLAALFAGKEEAS